MENHVYLTANVKGIMGRITQPTSQPHRPYCETFGSHRSQDQDNSGKTSLCVSCDVHSEGRTGLDQRVGKNVNPTEFLPSTKAYFFASILIFCFIFILIYQEDFTLFSPEFKHFSYLKRGLSIATYQRWNWIFPLYLSIV